MNDAPLVELLSGGVPADDEPIVVARVNEGVAAFLERRDPNFSHAESARHGKDDE